MSAKAFAAQIDLEFGQRMEEVELIIQKIAMEALSRLVLKSPVDTGLFRGNWQVGVGKRITTPLATVDPIGNKTLERGNQTIQTYDGDVSTHIYIRNNLPYAVPLETGHSAQAPNGMVALTLVELELKYAEVEL